jgi:hypothetical protein
MACRCSTCTMTMARCLYALYVCGERGDLLYIYIYIYIYICIQRERESPTRRAHVARVEGAPRSCRSLMRRTPYTPMYHVRTEHHTRPCIMRAPSIGWACPTALRGLLNRGNGVSGFEARERERERESEIEGSSMTFYIIPNPFSLPPHSRRNLMHL